MRIYQTGNNIIPKVIAVFMTPLWAVPLAQGIKYDAVLLILLAVTLLITTIWTFLGKSERYVDTDKQKVISQKKWLWFIWGDESPLSQYKYVAVVDQVYTPDRGPSSLYWNVNLVGKYSTSNKTGGFDTNFNLKSFDSKKNSKEEVMQFANRAAKELNMDIHMKASF